MYFLSILKRKLIVATKELGGPLPRKETRDEETEELIGVQAGGGVIRKVLDEFETGNVTSRWILFPRTYNKKEEKILISKVVMIGVEIYFSSHVYEFKETLYRQKTNGVVEVRLAGEKPEL